MGVYAEKSDLERFFSGVNISDWADKDRDGQLSEDELLAIDSAIDAAEAMVDNYLARAGYAAPFDAESFNELPLRIRSLIRQWTVIIAGFYIYSWRGLRDKNTLLERLYQTAIEQLRSLATGVPLAGMSKSLKVSFGTGLGICSRAVSASEGASRGSTDSLEDLRKDAWDW